MFSCSFCAFSSKSFKTYALHISQHRNVANTGFPCGVKGCHRKFIKFSSFKSHLYRDHNVKTQKSFSSVTASNLDLKCSISDICSFVCQNLQDYFCHLRQHMSNGQEIECPFKSCGQKFKVKSSFSSHISRKHRDWSFENLLPTVVDSENGAHCIPNIEDKDNENIDIEEEDSACENPVNEKEFLNSVALFYLKLQAKFLLPASTIQDIIENFQDLHTFNKSHQNHEMLKRLQLLNIPTIDAKNLIAELEKTDLFTKCNKGQLKTDHLRQSHFKNSFSYIQPIDVYLGKDKFGKDNYYKYIPINETLQSLMQQDDVREEYTKMHAKKRVPNVYNDITDGNVFTGNQFFKDNPSALRIILYQDAFEVANPLGSGKNKHKMLAVYMMLADVQPHHRSNTDQMQLVILCREQDFKYFGMKVFQPLVNDLKHLEDIGISVQDHSFVKGTVVAACGDNLGSHSIGGFTENFSTSQHFCRYCLIDRNTFYVSPLSLGPVRDKQSYQNDVTHLKADNSLNNVHGVKFDSIFNDLKYFHVCLPGLPPCLGHDLFEGVVAIDLHIYLTHLVKVDKLFSFEELNKCIQTFKYSGSDANNKPCLINASSEKLNGSATQNWCFLRLFPFFIGSKIKDGIDNPVWHLCLQLKEIVELVSAPELSADQIGYMKVVIETYIADRCTAFPNKVLKPKHHFLLHYSELTLQFGPLIRVWTLRFESKHSYFKQCARKLQNFKNLVSTFATRHQMLQAFLSVGSLFSKNINIDEGIQFYISSYNTAIQNAVKAVNISLSSVSTVATSNIVFKGTPYRRGMFVLLKEIENGMLFGKIELVLVHEDAEVFLLVKTCSSVYLMDLGLYDIEEDGNILCCNVDSLLDYYPLPAYKLKFRALIALHHSPMLLLPE